MGGGSGGSIDGRELTMSKKTGLGKKKRRGFRSGSATAKRTGGEIVSSESVQIGGIPEGGGMKTTRVYLTKA